jgi:hypothetical protein
MHWWLEIPLREKVLRPIKGCIFLRVHCGHMIETPHFTDSPR